MLTVTHSYVRGRRVARTVRFTTVDVFWAVLKMLHLTVCHLPPREAEWSKQHFFFFFFALVVFFESLLVLRCPNDDAV